jgi:hypothetical protein
MSEMSNDSRNAGLLLVYPEAAFHCMKDGCFTVWRFELRVRPEFQFDQISPLLTTLKQKRPGEEL